MSRAALLLVAVGGALGAGTRFLVTGSISTVGSPLDLGVLTVNTVGCLVLGLVLVAATARPTWSTMLRAGVGTGFCGGLTTFSTLGVTIAESIANEAYRTAATEVAVSVALGAVAMMVGRSLGRRLNSARPA